MLILHGNRGESELAAAFSGVDAALEQLEARIADGEALPLRETVERAIELTRRLIVACIARDGKKVVPAADADLLEAFRFLVRGEPSWHAIRDNCRELMYYLNCINMRREDALPRLPEKMAVRTARHIFLYVKTRCRREGRLED